VACADQIGTHPVHLGRIGTHKRQTDAMSAASWRRPGRIERFDGLDRVPCHPQPTGQCRLDVILRVHIIRDLQPELGVERQRSGHVVDHQADQVESPSHVVSS
jgi:hypothetical protein